MRLLVRTVIQNFNGGGGGSNYSDVYEKKILGFMSSNVYALSKPT